MSMVMDSYTPRGWPWNEPAIGPETVGNTTTWIDLTYGLSKEEVDQLRKMIREFKDVTEAARKIDEATNQPDCADPKKVELEQRVAVLEHVLADMQGESVGEPPDRCADWCGLDFLDEKVSIGVIRNAYKFQKPDDCNRVYCRPACVVKAAERASGG